MGGYIVASRKIPTEEELLHASNVLRRRARGLSKVREVLRGKFATTPMHDIFVMDRSEHEFHAFVFYKNKQHVDKAAKSGLSQEITDAIFEELEVSGRGGRSENELVVEFDSDENVQEEYEGDYYLRLR